MESDEVTKHRSLDTWRLGYPLGVKDSFVCVMESVIRAKSVTNYFA